MRWLTQAEVKIAAKKSKRAAIACSKKHWKQNATATQKETEAGKGGLTDDRLCALCQRYGEPSCEGCPLKKSYKCYCCKVYHDADDAYGSWDNGYGSGKFSTWQKKAKAMYDKLCSL